MTDESCKTLTPASTVRPMLRRAEHILSSVFGYKAFRSHQADIVEMLIGGGDAFVLMPTGGGKSLCYQVPALVRDGTGIVVSPLIALMQDQVDALGAVGVKAAFLNSSQDRATQERVIESLLSGNLDLLYVAPERLMKEHTLSLLTRAQIALIAIDEAHCVSQWGHDFRPEYRQLRVLAERFPDIPRVALTATADQRTREEIVEELALQDAAHFVASFDRPNIRYTISEGGRTSAREKLWRFIEREHPKDAGIVYCLSRRAVEETAKWLTQRGRTALAYHAGLDPDVRAATQSRFLSEDGVIVCATIAFGMGVDKPDVRFVAHLNLPKTVEAYYQETGRAGRDGAPANAWMSYGFQDLIQQRQWIEQSEGSETHRRVQRQKLDALIGLCEAASCRRQILLSYFGQDLAEPCGNCDNCLSPPLTIDGTVIAQKALSAIYRTQQRFGVTYLIQVLQGKADPRVVQNRHDQLSVFGIGADIDMHDWRGVFRQLLARGYVMQDGDGHQTLGLAAKARALLKGTDRFVLRRTAEDMSPKPERQRGEKRPVVRVASQDQLLFDSLKALRRDLARDARVPPYVVCHDRALAELASQRPRTQEALHDITGFGKAKIAKFGVAFITLITAHVTHDAQDPHDAENTRAAHDRQPDLQGCNLSPTVRVSLDMVRNGQSIEAVADLRGLAPSAIYKQIAEAIEAGAVDAHTVLELDAAERDEIEAAFDRCNTRETARLKAAYEALEGRYDYGVLRCMLAAAV